MEIKGKVAIVTGVSRGIGKACMEALLAKGVKVAGWGRSDPKVQDANFHFIPCDVRKLEEVENAFKQTITCFSTIDYLINNAGLGYFGKTEQLPLEQWHEMFDVNVHGLFYCIKAVVPHLKQQKSGHIINISSIAGTVAVVEGAGYSATKYAVRAISQALFKELREFNIKVSVIYPGSTRTDFFNNIEHKLRFEDMIDPSDIALSIVQMLESSADYLPVELEVRTMRAR